MKPIVCIALFAGLFSVLAYRNAPTPAQQEWKKHLIQDKEKGIIFSATAADFSGDGKMDVISSHNGDVFLLTGPAWQATLIHQFDTKNERAIASVSIDVDGDGDLDWIGGDAHTGAIWLENPSQQGAKWTARYVDKSVNGIHSIILADVNNDGTDDVIINNFKPEGELANSSMWYEIPNKASELDQWPRHIFAKGNAAGGSHYFGFGDIDGDGWGEIALAAKGKPYENGNWFAYWKNPGEAKVKQAWQKVILRENEIGATNILIQDLDGDGKNDFVISNGHGLGIAWLKAPDWEWIPIDQEMDCPHSLAAADFDQDGDVDIASCGYESKRLSVYLNDGKGKFQRRDLDLKQESYDLQAIDMDNDGDLDLLNAGRKFCHVVWYENPLK